MSSPVPVFVKYKVEFFISVNMYMYCQMQYMTTFFLERDFTHNSNMKKDHETEMTPQCLINGLNCFLNFLWVFLLFLRFCGFFVLVSYSFHGPVLCCDRSRVSMYWGIISCEVSFRYI